MYTYRSQILGAVKDRLARELGAEEQSLVLVRIEWRRRVGLWRLSQRTTSPFFQACA